MEVDEVNAAAHYRFVLNHLRPSSTSLKPSAVENT